MIKVFIGGSQSITKLPATVAARIDKIVEGDFTVLIGDARGVDACVQKYLAEKAYANALVFCTGICRNNAGGWKTMVVIADAGETGFDFYALKDWEMAREADYGFMVWDGKSKGTLNNVLNLLCENMSTLVFLSPDESFHRIRNAEDFSTLLAKCGERGLAVFEERLQISKRLDLSDGLRELFLKK
ncbi:MAG: hypothetical protein L0220_05795 [Acidobacteria bacterium]|nr:hypothetical protein [Acidobacteriota bacterium]